MSDIEETDAEIEARLMRELGTMQVDFEASADLDPYEDPYKFMEHSGELRDEDFDKIQKILRNEEVEDDNPNAIKSELWDDLNKMREARNDQLDKFEKEELAPLKEITGTNDPSRQLLTKESDLPDILPTEEKVFYPNPEEDPRFKSLGHPNVLAETIKIENAQNVGNDIQETPNKENGPSVLVSSGLDVIAEDPLDDYRRHEEINFMEEEDQLSQEYEEYLHNQRYEQRKMILPEIEWNLRENSCPSSIFFGCPNEVASSVIFSLHISTPQPYKFRFIEPEKSEETENSAEQTNVGFADNAESDKVKEVGKQNEDENEKYEDHNKDLEPESDSDIDSDDEEDDYDRATGKPPTIIEEDVSLCMINVDKSQTLFKKNNFLENNNSISVSHLGATRLPPTARGTAKMADSKEEKKVKIIMKSALKHLKLDPVNVKNGRFLASTELTGQLFPNRESLLIKNFEHQITKLKANADTFLRRLESMPSKFSKKVSNDEETSGIVRNTNRRKHTQSTNEGRLEDVLHMVHDPDTATSLKKIVIKLEKLSQICGLEPYENLESLNLACNNLSFLDGLDRNKKLEELIVSQNQLTSLESGLLKLKKLKTLHVDINKLSSLTGLECCPLLEDLNVNFNKLTTLDGLQNSVNVIKLQVFKNQVTNLSCLKTLNRLTYLHVGHNQIKDINIVAENHPVLQTLIADGNRINQISSKFSLIMLKELWLDRNAIRVLNLGFCPLLEKLSASDNHIEVLELSGSPLLVDLNVGFNQIASVQALVNGIADLKNLETFNAQENPIFNEQSLQNKMKITLIRLLPKLSQLNGGPVLASDRASAMEFKTVLIDSTENLILNTRCFGALSNKNWLYSSIGQECGNQKFLKQILSQGVLQSLAKRQFFLLKYLGLCRKQVHEQHLFNEWEKESTTLEQQKIRWSREMIHRRSFLGVLQLKENLKVDLTTGPVVSHRFAYLDTSIRDLRKREGAAFTIQALWLSYKFRKSQKLRYFKSYEEQIRKIQATFRMYLVKSKFSGYLAQKRQERLESENRKAVQGIDISKVITIQKMFRGYRDRKRFKKFFKKIKYEDDDLLDMSEFDDKFFDKEFDFNNGLKFPDDPGLVNLLDLDPMARALLGGGSTSLAQPERREESQNLGMAYYEDYKTKQNQLMEKKFNNQSVAFEGGSRGGGNNKRDDAQSMMSETEYMQPQSVASGDENYQQNVKLLQKMEEINAQKRLEAQAKKQKEKEVLDEWGTQDPGLRKLLAMRMKKRTKKKSYEQMSADERLNAFYNKSKKNALHQLKLVRSE